MKHLLTTSVLALAGAVLLGQSAEAQTTTYSDGDIMLGMYTSGQTQDFEVDLGSYQQFALATSSVTIPIALNDLSAALGPNWNTNSQTFWGILGTVNGSSDSYVQQYTTFVSYAGTPPSSWTNGVKTPPFNIDTFQKSASSGINIMADDLSGNGFNGNPTTTTTPDSLIEATSKLESWYSTLTTGGAVDVDFGGFTNVGFTNVFDGGALRGTSDLNLYEYQQIGTSPTGQVWTANEQGELLGTFSISIDNTDGVADLTFQPVPEPSTYASLALGALGLFGMARLRGKRA